jgi:DNA-binding SARP family transcriptional activator/TolB-like protein
LKHLIAPHFRLDLLGDPAFSSPAGPVQGRAAHKRRVALLALLAVARGRPVGRERLIGLLWPELTSEAARHNLSETLYVLRKELGDEAIVSPAGGDLALGPAVVESDVAEFQALLDAGDAEAAVHLYRGPLLDGFYVADAPEFERWAEGERDRLARAYGRALEGLAETAETEGSAIRAVDWWRRLASHDPFSSRTALRLVRALDAAGERPSALRAAETHAAMLREELGVEPDPDLKAFVARLRTEPPRDSASPSPSSSPSPPPRPAVPAEPPLAPRPFTPLPLAPAAADAPVEHAADDAAEPPVPAALVADGAAGLPANGGGGAAGAAVEKPGTGAAGRAPAGRGEADGAAAAPAGRGGVAEGGGPWRRMRVAIYYAAIAGVVVGMMLSVLSVWAADRRERDTGPRYDPHRIAVLYFEDLSPNGELQYLATGLTERLIHELSQVGALDVVSRGGVKRYRGGAVAFDSMVAELRVGSVVEGTLQRSGDSVWVTVNLVDANSETHLQSREVVRPLGDVVALERAVAGEVSAALRQRLGEEVRLREATLETRSADALRLVLQAGQLRRDARETADGRDPLDTGSAAALLVRADSLLALAEAADPRWPEPTLLRGWVDVARSNLATGTGKGALLRAAFGRGDAVLRRAGPRRADALELRGTALYLLALDAADTVVQHARMDTAERDLRGAVAAEPARAGTWSTLSQLLRIRGRLAESDLAARRALAEDAYLDEASEIRHRLFFTALWRADYPAARDECEQGHRQFPGDWRFTECQLTLLRNDRSRPPDAAAAWRLAAELDRLDPPARARAQGRAYGPLYRRMVAAAVSARGGNADSARAVVARARGEVAGDADLGFSLDYDEAWVRLALGDTTGARALVSRMMRYRPAMRSYLLRDPFVRGLGVE